MKPLDNKAPWEPLKELNGGNPKGESSIPKASKPDGFRMIHELAFKHLTS